MLKRIAEEIYLGEQWLRTYARERKRWTVQPDAERARVFYGIDRIPGAGEKAFGGIVKCQDLETVFPSTPSGANILYLVSSALPLHACLMAKFARKAGVRIVLNQDGVAYQGWHGPGWKRTNRPAKFLVHFADHVFFQSRFSRASADHFLGQRNGSADILYNPVDTRTFVPAPQSHQFDKIVLLLSGSHWSEYRVASAIQALALLLKRGVKARLKIAGRFCWEKDEAVAKRSMEQLCRELNVVPAVEFAGTYTQSEAVKLFQSAHILMHTKYNDPCPRLVVEAMACGLPVVYSGSGGTPELVGTEAGYSVEAPLDWEHDQPPSTEGLADGVIRIAGRLPEYSRAARNRAVEHFDVRPWLDRHRQVFESLMCRK